MKGITIFCALLLVTVFFLGCGKQSTPTEMSLDMPADGADTLYKGGQIVIEGIPFAFVEVNACTDLPHDVFGTLDIRIHNFILNADGDHHFQTHFKFDVETSDGYSGSVVQQIVDNGKGPGGSPDEEFSQSITFNVNLSNEDGQRLKQHGVFNITIRNGVVVRSSVANFSEKCVGKPS